MTKTKTRERREKFLWGFKFLKSLKFLIIFLLGKKMQMLMIVMILTLMEYCEE